MSTVQCRLLPVAIGAALLQGGAAGAQTTYEGRVASGIGGTIATAGGITPAAASYSLGGGTDSVSSISLSDFGGSVASEAHSLLLVEAAKTQIQYTFRLVGPAGPPVPVEVIASGFADGSGIYGTASAYFTLDALVPIFGYVSHSYGMPRQSFAIDQIIPINPNTDVFISLLAMASAGSPSDTGPSFGIAFADPRFVIDPAYAAAYTLVGVPTAVPEPGTALMGLLGGVGLGAARLGRRRMRAN